MAVIRKPMNYKQTLTWLYEQLPMFHRIGTAAYKADLSNTIELCENIGNPQLQFPNIHIAGTNGKGSTSHYLASILQEAGYKTGLFTSPHLKDFRERIRINGRMIPKREVTSFVNEQIKSLNAINPSFFEWTFGLAAWYFAKEKIEIAVIETGMGGRLDSTNIVNPVITVITNIGLDHTQFLGKTLPAIAAEKAGIIKQNVPVIIGESQEETTPVFTEFALRNNAPLFFADKQVVNRSYHFSEVRTRRLIADFDSQESGERYKISSPLAGKYQLKNLATVITSVELLKDSGFNCTVSNIQKGISHVIRNTGFIGRWQTLGKKPLSIADIGHNPDGIREVVENIKLTPHKKLHFVLGVVSDKDIDGILAFLPREAIYYFCKADIPRALNAAELADAASNYFLKGRIYNSVKEAYETARASAEPDDLVFVGGSAFVVAEVM